MCIDLLFFLVINKTIWFSLHFQKIQSVVVTCRCCSCFFMFYSKFSCFHVICLLFPVLSFQHTVTLQDYLAICSQNSFFLFSLLSSLFSLLSLFLSLYFLFILFILFIYFIFYFLFYFFSMGIRECVGLVRYRRMLKEFIMGENDQV